MAEAAYLPITPESLPAAADLLRRVFPKERKFTPAYLDWLYFKNPTAPGFGFNIVVDDRIVGHVAAVPQAVALHGQPTQIALMVNGATDESVRGRGLYLRLIRHMIEEAGRLGFAAVSGVANQNTIRAYETKLGFQNVAGLAAFVSAAPERLDVGRAVERAQWRRVWDDPALAWRLANPHAPLKVVAGDGAALVVEGASTAPVIRARGVILRQGLAAPPLPRGRLWPAVTLGLAPDGAWRRGLALTVPDALRPSPLRMIYLNTADPADRLDPGRILFSFLDFDAF